MIIHDKDTPTFLFSRIQIYNRNMRDVSKNILKFFFFKISKRVNHLLFIC